MRWSFRFPAAPLVSLGVFLALAGASAPLRAQVRLEPLGTYATGIFGDSAAEIVAFDFKKQRGFVTNSALNRVDILDLQDPSSPVWIGAVDLAPFGDAPTSVAIRRGRDEVAVAVKADPVTDPGRVVFFDTGGALLGAVTVGSLPDSLAYTPDGKTVVVANEGEPNDEVTVDPPGSVSIIDVREGASRLVQADVTTAGFEAFNGREEELRAAGIRIFGQNAAGEPATVAQDLEPEGVTTSRDSRTAWVTLQENNAIAQVNLTRGIVTSLFGLGFKDHSLPGSGFDASDKDGAISIRPWPVLGMYQPDGIAACEVDGETFLVTANEGDARDYDGFSEETRVADLTLCPGAFEDPETLQDKTQLGRLKTTLFPPAGLGEDGCSGQIYAYGARSFAIWDTDGRLVFESGDELEQLLADLLPADFNSNDDENDSFDKRSDDKGPEPESVVVGRVRGRTYAFVGLERIGGIMVYDITEPAGASFAGYANTRDFSVTDPAEVEAGLAGDLAPEGLAFVPHDRSPTGSPLLIVAFEVSGTVTVFEVVPAGTEDGDDGGGEEDAENGEEE